MNLRSASPVPTVVLIVLVVYSLASLGHYTHNAIYLERYPNMPAWITRSGVYGAWLCVAAVGLAGYALFVRGFKLLGLIVLGVYGALGLDGLAHYCLAPISAHSFTMNFSIWAESFSGVLLIVIAAALAFNHAVTCKSRSR